MESNLLGKHALALDIAAGGKQGPDIENSKKEKVGRPSYRQSAGVCIDISDRYDLKSSITAPQRINAKDLWYILGLIEGDGSFSCFLEGKYLRAEMVLGLEEADVKLVYWVKDQFKYGSVKLTAYSKTSFSTKTEIGITTAVP